MFQFVPPAKIARTQRNDFLLDVSVADVTGATDASLISADSAVSPALSGGIGSAISWIVRPAGVVEIYDHSLLSSARSSKVATAARTEGMPVFEEDEGEAAFAAELAAQRTVAFCSRTGTVVSVDKFLQASFEDASSTLEVSAFDCSSTTSRCAAAVGTKTGAILVGTKSGLSFPLQFLRLDKESLGDGKKAGRSGWWGWLGRSAPAAGATPAAGSSNPNAVVLLRFSSCDATRLLASTADGHVVMLSMADAPVEAAPLTIVWALSPREVACVTGGQATPTMAVVAVTHSRDAVALLVAVETAAPGAAVAARLVTVNASTGCIVNSVSIAYQGLFGSTMPSPGAATVALDTSPQSQMAVVVTRNCLLRINNSVGVRSPCAAEDVKRYSHASGAIAAGVMLPAPDRRVVMLLPSRPLVVEGGDASAAAGLLNLKTVSNDQILAKIREAFRPDSRETVAQVCFHELEEILCVYAAHDANWARANRDAEDHNLLTHVTRSVQRRRAQVEEFVLLVVAAPDICSALGDDAVTSLTTTADHMMALEAVRLLQNFDPSAGTDPTLGVDSTEGRAVQALLREAIATAVAEIRRAADPAAINANMSATEIFYSKPSHVELLLRILNDRVLAVFDLREAMNKRERFNVAVSVGIVFLVIASKLLKWWSTSGLDSVRHVLWNTPAGNARTTLFAQQSFLLSDVLGLLQTDELDLEWRRRAQKHLLAALENLLHLQLRVDPEATPDGLMAAGSPLIRRTLFREPFVARPTGYPYGAPRAAHVDCESLLKAAWELAKNYCLADIIFDFLFADFRDMPNDVAAFREFIRGEAEVRTAVFPFAQRERALHTYAIRELSRTGRERELALVCSGAPQDVVDAVLGGYPHMLRRLKPKMISAILQEGHAAGGAYVAYADNAVDHLSRCVALARLAAAASGATAAIPAVSRRERYVAAHREVGEKSSLLPPQVLVDRLKKKGGGSYGLAASIANDVEDMSTRRQLLTDMVTECYAREQRKLQATAEENTRIHDVTSLADEVLASVTGKVLKAAAPWEEQEFQSVVIEGANVDVKVASLLWHCLCSSQQ